MNNKAKCKLCNSIVESFHATDYVICNCGEIFVDGGLAMRCGSRNWENFVRIDDEGNEIIPKITESKMEHENNPTKLTKKEMIGMLDEIVKSIENLPQPAMTAPITHYDYISLLMLLSSIFKEDLSD